MSDLCQRAIELVILFSQIPSREIDKSEGKLWTQWNNETKQVRNREERGRYEINFFLSSSFSSSFTSSRIIHKHQLLLFHTKTYHQDKENIEHY